MLLARAQAGAVGIAFAGVMVVTTAAALQGVPILRAFLASAVVAYAAAVAYTYYDLTRTPAEVLLGDGLGAVRSVWEVAITRGWRTAPAFVPVYHPRKGDGALLVGIGDTVVAFRPVDWPDFDALRDALTAAADATDAARFALAAP